MDGDLFESGQGLFSTSTTRTTMRQFNPDRRPDRALHQPGEIVSASYILDPSKPTSRKFRPVVIVSPGLCTHKVLGLTTQRVNYRGRDRTPLHWPLDSPRVSYLWTNFVTNVSRIDISRHIGWLDEDSMTTIMDSVDIPEEFKAQFQIGVYNAREVY